MASRPEFMIRAKQSGDWWYRDGEISVAVLQNCYPPESELAIMIHELVEAFLCQRDGVPDNVVVAFDEMFEAEREQGQHKHDAEPGDAPESPYRYQHQMATHVEKAVCLALGLRWEEHEKAIYVASEESTEPAEPSVQDQEKKARLTPPGSA